MRDELEIPFHFAGVGVERQDAIGEEIVAWAVAAVEIGPWIARRPVQQVQFGIVGAGRPSGPTTVFEGEVTPGFRSRLAFLRYRPYAPGLLPGFGRKRGNETGP